MWEESESEKVHDGNNNNQLSYSEKRAKKADLQELSSWGKTTKNKTCFSADNWDIIADDARIIPSSEELLLKLRGI